MIANDDVVLGWRRLDYILDHPLSIRSIDDVWIEIGRVFLLQDSNDTPMTAHLLQDSIDTLITVPLVPICIADVCGEEAKSNLSEYFIRTRYVRPCKRITGVGVL